MEQSFTHQVDKKAIPTCPILGVNIAAIDMPWLLAFTEKHLGALSGDYICVSNVHTTVTAWKDEAYRAVQNGGILAVPDGGPLSSTGRKRGYESMRRVTGPDYMLKAIELGLSKGWRHYFYDRPGFCLGRSGSPQAGNLDGGPSGETPWPHGRCGRGL